MTCNRPTTIHNNQYEQLFARSFKQARRNKFVLVVKIVSSVFFALILGT